MQTIVHLGRNITLFRRLFTALVPDPIITRLMFRGRQDLTNRRIRRVKRRQRVLMMPLQHNKQHSRRQQIHINAQRQFNLRVT